MSVCAEVDELMVAIEALNSRIAELESEHPHVEDDCFYATVWAEDNGTLTNNRWDYSFGNGNEEATNPVNWGYVAHYDYEIVSMSIGMRGTNTAATEVGVTVNGANVPVSAVVPGSQTKIVNNAVSYSGSAGDTLNFRTLQNGGGNDVVPSIILKYTLP